MSKNLRAALLSVLALMLAVPGLPAAAQDASEGLNDAAEVEEAEESEAQLGALEVEVRPAVVAPGASILVAAEFDPEDADDDAPEDESREDVFDPPTEEGSDVADDTPEGPGDAPRERSRKDNATVMTLPESSTAGREVAVDFSIDFGDGSGAQQMVLTRQDVEDVEGRAVKQHRYEAAGDYTITVTAAPIIGETVTATVVVNVGSGSARLGGGDRFETSTRVSRESFPQDGSAQAVLLARADGFADALAAASLALHEDAPVLLTASAELPQLVIEEVTRALVAGGSVYLLGGESALAPSVAEALSGLGYTVERIAGADRVDTAVRIAEFLMASGADLDEVVLANAGNFPDALAGAAYAAAAGAPVLLTGSEALDPRVADLLTVIGDGAEVLLAGGEAAVSDAVLGELVAMGAKVTRLSGDTRFATSAAVAEALFDEATAVVVATGATFPDALSGAAHAGRLGAPVLLVGETLPDAVREYLAERRGQVEVVYVLGGENAVPAAVMAEVEQTLGLEA